MKTDKRLLLVVLSLVLLCCFAINSSAATKAKSSSVESVDKIVAVVNSDVITESELQQKIAIAKKQFAHSDAPMPSMKEMRAKVLDALIAESLQLQLAKKNNMSVTDEDVNNAIADIVKRNNINLAQLKQELEKQGTNYINFRKQMQEEILLSRLQQQAVGRDVIVTDQEVTAFLRSSHAVMLIPNTGKPAAYQVVDILITMPDDASAAKQQEIKTMAAGLLAKLQHKDANFDQIVKDSMQSNIDIHRNDLGWRKLSDLPSIFITEIGKMQVGDIAGPIQAPNGLHLIKLVASQGGKEKAQKLTKEQAHEIIYRNKMGEKIKTWVQNLRSTSYVKITDE